MAIPILSRTARNRTRRGAFPKRPQKNTAVGKPPLLGFFVAAPCSKDSRCRQSPLETAFRRQLRSQTEFENEERTRLRAKFRLERALSQRIPCSNPLRQRTLHRNSSLVPKLWLGNALVFKAAAFLARFPLRRCVPAEFGNEERAGPRAII